MHHGEKTMCTMVKEFTKHLMQTILQIKIIMIHFMIYSTVASAGVLKAKYE